MCFIETNLFTICAHSTTTTIPCSKSSRRNSNILGKFFPSCKQATHVILQLGWCPSCSSQFSPPRNVNSVLSFWRLRAWNVAFDKSRSPSRFLLQDLLEPEMDPTQVCGGDYGNSDNLIRYNSYSKNDSNDDEKRSNRDHDKEAQNDATWFSPGSLEEVILAEAITSMEPKPRSVTLRVNEVFVAYNLKDTKRLLALARPWTLYWAANSQQPPPDSFINIPRPKDLVVPGASGLPGFEPPEDAERGSQSGIPAEYLDHTGCTPMHPLAMIQIKTFATLDSFIFLRCHKTLDCLDFKSIEHFTGSDGVPYGGIDHRLVAGIRCLRRLLSAADQVADLCRMIQNSDEQAADGEEDLKKGSKDGQAKGQGNDPEEQTEKRDLKERIKKQNKENHIKMEINNLNWYIACLQINELSWNPVNGNVLVMRTDQMKARLRWRWDMDV